MLKTILCIVCPNGCRLRAEKNEATGVIAVSGNRCKRGPAFAEAELTNPVRSVTTTLATVFPEAPALPVRTRGEIPKDAIPALMKALAHIVVEKKIGLGETAAEIPALGISMAATSNVLRELPLSQASPGGSGKP